MASFLLLSLMVNSCSNASTPLVGESAPPATKDNLAASGKTPLVVATTDVICKLAKTIAKETVGLKCLIAAGADPHTYAVTAIIVQKADTVVTE
jgi:manganese/iron transport system substrate-binding protein